MSYGFGQFTWRGEPIHDIKEWANSRNERMVNYHAERQVPCPWTGGMMTEEYDGTMPETFWNSLAISHGWHYRELKGENATNPHQ